MLVIWMEEVSHVSNVVVSYAYKVPVWLRRIVAIIIISNHEFFPDLVASLCGDVGQEIIGKW